MAVQQCTAVHTMFVAIGVARRSMRRLQSLHMLRLGAVCLAPFLYFTLHQHYRQYRTTLYCIDREKQLPTQRRFVESTCADLSSHTAT